MDPGRFHISAGSKQAEPVAVGGWWVVLVEGGHGKNASEWQ